jgi:hypothetical protein
MSEGSRQLADHEQHLLRWMLEHGNPEAAAFLPQLDEVEVTPWKCKCGCASINFQLRGHGEAPPGTPVHPIADFIFGAGDAVSGIFVFEKNGMLSGLEVYGLAGDAPKSLPRPEELRVLGDSAAP